jgi:hypothetical protein
MSPLRLSDDELNAVFAAAKPLDPDLRDPFLRAVAAALQGQTVIGPGLVARVCAELQRQFFRPPILDHPGKHARTDATRVAKLAHLARYDRSPVEFSPRGRFKAQTLGVAPPQSPEAPLDPVRCCASRGSRAGALPGRRLPQLWLIPHIINGR